MTYKGLKIIQLIVYLSWVAISIFEMTIEPSFSIVGTAFLLGGGCLLVTWLISRKRYPQWKDVSWWISWKIMIPAMLALVAAFVILEIYDYRIGHLMIFPSTALLLFVLTNPIYDVFCTIKYDMDRFNSVEKLTAAYPEAKGRLRKSML